MPSRPPTCEEDYSPTGVEDEDESKIEVEPSWNALAAMWLAESDCSWDVHTAASIGDVDGVKRWIESGTDINALNSGGWTPLMYGAYLGHESVCRALIGVPQRVGAKKKKKYGDDDDEEEAESKMETNREAKEESIDDGLLVEKKDRIPVEIDARSRKHSQTALMLAAACGNEHIVELLLQHNAAITTIDNSYRTALHYATNCNHTHIVRQLLIAGANPNQAIPSTIDQPPSSDTPYRTPFVLAIKDGLELIVQAYLEFGALESTTSSSSLVEMTRSVAKRYGHMKIQKMLDEHIAKKSGEKAPKYDYPPKRRSSIQDGPRAVSSLMKLQSKLTTANDSGAQPKRGACASSVRLDSRRQPIRKKSTGSRDKSNDDSTAIDGQKSRRSSTGGGDDAEYEKTLTAEDGTNGQQPKGEQQREEPRDPLWRPTTIDELMEILQLTKYTHVFREVNVDLEKLLTMNGDGLKEMGISLFGPRKKILNAIERWNEKLPLTGPC